MVEAARETGHNPQTVGRMADEIRTTDGTNRAIIFGDDDTESARERIRQAFNGQDDPISFDEEADPSEAPVDEATPTDPGAMNLATGLRTDDVIWKLLVPAGIVFVLKLILVRF